MRHLHLRSGAFRRSLVGACGALLTTALLLGAASPPAVSQGDGPARHRVVTRFHPKDGTFTESMTWGRHGCFFVSRTRWAKSGNVGRVVKVGPACAKRYAGPALDLGPTGLLTGIVQGPRLRLYVGYVDWSLERPAAVYRLGPAGWARVATFPEGSFPNGLELHKGRLFVSDSVLGSVWRVDPSADTQQLTGPWLHGKALMPRTRSGLGANGLAFHGDQLFVVNDERGTLLRVHVRPGGHPGSITRIRTDVPLTTADGLSFDAGGRLWVTRTGSWNPQTKRLENERVVQLTRNGRMLQSIRGPWLNYPTTVLHGRATSDTVFVLDGAFRGGWAKIVRFRDPSSPR